MGCCNVFTTNAIHVAVLSFHCRHPTVPKCGGSGPCLSGGELDGVCWQRQVHVLCVGVSMYTCVNRMSHSSPLAALSVVGLCCRTKVHICIQGTMLYIAQLCMSVSFDVVGSIKILT